MKRSNTIKLTESRLRGMIREAVKNVLRESTFVNPGKKEFGHFEPVPYDDDYIERYGNSEPFWTDDQEEKRDINSLTYNLALRVQKTLERAFGELVRVDVSEDDNSFENSNGNWVDSLYANLTITATNVPKGRVIALVSKIVGSADFVRNFSISSKGMNQINVEVFLDTNKTRKNRTLQSGDFTWS